jgi:para-nitrobenzyl esterase
MGSVTDEVIARTAQGMLRGARDGDGLSFLGIPYATAPDGPLRFAEPLPHPAWDGIRDALAYGATSPQPDRGVTLIPEPIVPGDNELNLNVFTPDLGAAGLPVLVWIHGGGFFGGCNASPWYRGESFVRDGVVLVSINYRLGFSGFLEAPGAAANRAVRDWVRALEWVRENIASFGGDPDKVTIAGQSAGGGACGTLLGVPSARGLFRGAICMSGSVALVQNATGVRTTAARMSALLGDLAELDAALLSSLPVQTLLAAQDVLMAESMGAMMAGGEDPAAVTGALSAPVRLPFAPWADGEVVTSDPLAAAAAAGVPVIAGNTASEFNMGFMGADWITAGMVRDGLAKAGMPAALAAEYLERPGMRPCDVAGQAVTDRTFRAPAQHMASAVAEAGGAAWVYDFRWAAPGGPLPGLAFHCLDVPFAFDLLGAPGVAEVTAGGAPESLAAAMHGAFVRFIASGDPGWPRYDLGSRKAMIFAAEPAVLDDPLRLEREAWPARLSDTCC